MFGFFRHKKVTHTSDQLVKRWEKIVGPNPETYKYYTKTTLFTSLQEDDTTLFLCALTAEEF